MSSAPRAQRSRPPNAFAAWRRLLLVCSTGTLAAVCTAAAIQPWHATRHEWTTFWLLASLTAATYFFSVRGRRDSVYGTESVFLVAAAVILPPEFAPFVAVPGCLINGLRREAPPFLVLHNVFTAALATLAASAIAHSSHEQPTAARAGVLLASALVYSIVASGLDRLFSNLGRGRRPLPALAVEEVGTEFVLACLGLALASFWAYDPWRIPLAFTALILAHRSQRLPKLEQEAVTDAKTGLLNMRRFDEGLEVALARARAEKRPLCLIAVDLDLLREINNTHGHLVGDAVIKGISTVLRQQIRRDDLAARFGGEEFLLALLDTPPDRALRIAERIREAVASRVFAGEEQSPVATRATISAGVAAFPRDATSARGLIHAADLAVLTAKARGRNRVVDAADIRVDNRKRVAGSPR